MHEQNRLLGEREPNLGLPEQMEWRRGPAPHEAGRPRSAVELGPTSAYEVVTRQMVEDLAEELREIKGRLNGILWMVAGAMLLDVILRVTGAAT